MIRSMKRLILIVVVALLLLTTLLSPGSSAYAEACTAGSVVWGSSVGGYTGEFWSGNQYYKHAYTYSKPATSYVTLKAWVTWWETCDGVYAGGGSSGPVTAYNSNWVRVKGPWHGYYCTGQTSLSILVKGNIPTVIQTK